LPGRGPVTERFGADHPSTIASKKPFSYWRKIWLTLPDVAQLSTAAPGHKRALRSHTLSGSRSAPQSVAIVPRIIH
jgi:hypothetical protein